MRHLKKYNESNNDNKITDKDFELIEDCFLDYITGTHEGEFVPRRCYINQSRSLFSHIEIHFVVPVATWNWAHGFLNEISGDIKRCESYGFNCHFCIFISNDLGLQSYNPYILLTIFKGRELPIWGNSIFIRPLYSLEDALVYTQENMDV